MDIDKELHQLTRTHPHHRLNPHHQPRPADRLHHRHSPLLQQPHRPTRLPQHNPLRFNHLSLLTLIHSHSSLFQNLYHDHILPRYYTKTLCTKKGVFLFVE